MIEATKKQQPNNKVFYYIDRCELLLHNYKCGGYLPCCATVNTHTIVNWKKSVKCYWQLWHITNMTSYEDFQFET
jgi:hypothetical protein